MSHLLNLPTELLEHILTLLCHKNAQTIQACRKACRTLNAIIACSQLVQYLERVALLGMSDPFLVEGVDVSATLSLADRVAALRAWEESWNAFAGGHDGNAGVFWQERRPNLRIASPSSPSARIKYILATIIDPGPPGSEQEEDWQFDPDDLCSFEPWFITATRTGFNVRASFSYLDLHGCLDGVGGTWGGEGASSRIESSEEENRDGNRNGDGDPGIDYDRVHWTVIKVPVRHVLAIALSTELDLALVISVEFNQGEERNYLVVRPLRFLDGTLHPCAKVPTMRFSVAGVSRLYTTQVQLLGDYLLLWIGHDGDELGDRSLSRIYLIAWKQGSITLLREFPVGKCGTVHIISNDVLALVQLEPLGIELCRLSKMTKKEGGGGGGDGGATIGHGSTNDSPRMDKLRTLLLPPLRERQHTGARARVTSAGCVGGHTSHQMSSNRPWPQYRSTPLGLRQMFRQSTKDSVVKITVGISGYKGLSRTIEVVMRCATLLAYAAEVVPTGPATIAADAETSNGDEDGEFKLASALAQSIVGKANADNDAEGGTSGGDVPWDAWGPQATAASHFSHIGWRVVFGERMVTVEAYPKYQLCIRDYNPYRIQQARGFMAAKGHSDGLGDEEEEQDEGEKNADTFHPKVTRRIVGSSTLPGGQWFKEDMTTALPHLETRVDLPPDPLGWTGIYLEQDQVLLRMGDIDQLDQINEGPYRRKRFQNGGSEGFALYCM